MHKGNVRLLSKVTPVPEAHTRVVIRILRNHVDIMQPDQVIPWVQFCPVPVVPNPAPRAV